MGIPVDVPGLDQVLGEVPDGSLLVLDGGLAPAKNHLARHLAKSGARAGRSVTLLTTRPQESVPGVAVREAHSWQDGPLGGLDDPGAPLASQLRGDLVVDSFSLLCADAAPAALASRMRGLKAAAQQGGTVAILVVDDGQLAPAAHAACQHLADTVVQFRAREDADGPIQFLRVAKAPQNQGLARNIFYSLEGPHLLIDTRRRVN